MRIVLMKSIEINNTNKKDVDCDEIEHGVKAMIRCRYDGDDEFYNNRNY